MTLFAMFETARVAENDNEARDQGGQESSVLFGYHRGRVRQYTGHQDGEGALLYRDT